ncbi:MAG: hypothetical protein ABJP02_01290 [Parasphingorhabdus sp.]|uniref:hypothetical protein n=1 Tax=Alphaproteobacteria TaxID=28211 RepID=UPI0032999EDF
MADAGAIMGDGLVDFWNDGQDWYGCLGQSLGMDRGELCESLLDFTNSRRAAAAPTRGHISKNWRDRRPASTPSTSTAKFLLTYLTEKHKKKFVSDDEAFAEIEAYLSSRAGLGDKGRASGSSDFEAAAKSLDGLYRHWLGEDPSSSRTPDGRDGFYVALRRRYGGQSIYQELLYIAPDAKEPSYMFSKLGRALAGRVAFVDSTLAYGFFGAPFAKPGNFSLRMVTMQFYKEESHKLATGIISRVCNSETKLMAAATVLWPCDNSDQRLEWALNALRQGANLHGKTSPAGQYVTEYLADSKVHKRLFRVLQAPLIAAAPGTLADKWGSPGDEGSVDTLINEHLGLKGKPNS